MFTAELNEKQEAIELYLNTEGIDQLIAQLQSLRNENSHLHFMTPSWGGKELGETTHGENRLINHVIIYSHQA